MDELLKKSLLTGIGFLALGKDRCEAWFKDFAEKGKLNEEEGRELAKSWIEKADQVRDETKQAIDGMVEESLKKFSLVRQSDFDQVKQELNELRSELSELKSEREA